LGRGDAGDDGLLQRCFLTGSSVEGKHGVVIRVRVILPLMVITQSRLQDSRLTWVLESSATFNLVHRYQMNMTFLLNRNHSSPL
jgi:hypothetical protein